MDGILAVWGLAVVGVAVGVYGAALALGNRRHQRTLSERLGQIEEANTRARERAARRARLRAVIEQEVEVRWYLTIRNEGHGAARDCMVSIDGSALEQSPLIDAEALDLASIETVEPHSTVRIPLQVDGAPGDVQLELTWSDASEEVGFYEARLTR